MEDLSQNVVKISHSLVTFFHSNTVGNVIARLMLIFGVYALLWANAPERKEYAPTPLVMMGTVAPGWEKVQTEFQKLLEADEDHGAAFAVYHRGEMMVNLAGGYADKQLHRVWTLDTLSNLFSVSQGITAIVVALLVDRGHLDYKDTIRRYWPAFGACNKDHVTVQMLLSHRAGLPFLETLQDLHSCLDDADEVSRMLAKQMPFWSPGKKHGFHQYTLGLYLNEIVRRVDPDRRTIHQIFREDIADKYGLDISFGLDLTEFYRTTLITPPSMSWSSYLWFLWHPQQRRMFRLAHPDLAFGDLSKGMYNPEFARLPLTTVNGYATADSVAKLFGILTSDFVKEEQAETEGKTREDQDAWDESEGIFDRAIGPKLPVLPDFTEVALGVMAVELRSEKEGNEGGFKHPPEDRPAQAALLEICPHFTIQCCLLEELRGGSGEPGPLLTEGAVWLLTETLVSGRDEVLQQHVTYGRGTSPARSLVNTTQFGMWGLGGQAGYGDLTHQLGFSFLTNSLSQHDVGNDPRFLQLQRAMYASLFELEGKSEEFKSYFSSKWYSMGEL